MVPLCGYTGSVVPLCGYTGSVVPLCGYTGSVVPLCGYTGSVVPLSGYTGSVVPLCGYTGSVVPLCGYTGSVVPLCGYTGSVVPLSGYTGSGRQAVVDLLEADTGILGDRLPAAMGGRVGWRQTVIWGSTKVDIVVVIGWVFGLVGPVTSALCHSVAAGRLTSAL